ncbi:hypothetical protein GTY54_42430 [Streptomyces sp. SID625]|nr:hypothetical protein [Streptomyces sp. SID625]
MVSGLLVRVGPLSRSRLLSRPRLLSRSRLLRMLPAPWRLFSWPHGR